MTSHNQCSSEQLANLTRRAGECTKISWNYEIFKPLAEAGCIGTNLGEIPRCCTSQNFRRTRARVRPMKGIICKVLLGYYIHQDILSPLKQGAPKYGLALESGLAGRVCKDLKQYGRKLLRTKSPISAVIVRVQRDQCRNQETK